MTLAKFNELEPITVEEAQLLYPDAGEAGRLKTRKYAINDSGALVATSGFVYVAFYTYTPSTGWTHAGYEKRTYPHL